MTDICVHGLGYIGLPTAAVFANSGFDVVGYDVNRGLIESLQNNEVQFEEPGLDEFVTTALESGHLSPQTEIVPADTHIICVPTPFDNVEKEADLGYIKAAAEGVKPNLRAGDLVILESTVPPQTTETVLQPILEETGLEAGSDFDLAYCPETVLPGNIIHELRHNDRIIGGVTNGSTQRTRDLYESFVEGDIHEATSPSVAEFGKLIQNTFRDTNIALANEISVLAADYDVDSREVISLANSHPRVDILQPGPGVGGHCLPVDPWFLSHDSDNLRVIEAARQVNEGMADFIIDKIESELGGLKGTNIAILGAAYKGNVNDSRNSPGLHLAQRLQDRVTPESSTVLTDGGESEPSIQIDIEDPYVYDQTLNLSSFEEAVKGADCVVIATDHDQYADIDPTRLLRLMDGSLVVDSKDMIDSCRWEDAGLTVREI